MQDRLRNTCLQDRLRNSCLQDRFRNSKHEKWGWRYEKTKENTRATYERQSSSSNSFFKRHKQLACLFFYDWINIYQQQSTPVLALLEVKRLRRRNWLMQERSKIKNLITIVDLGNLTNSILILRLPWTQFLSYLWS